jgi:hypothetical protein
VVDTEARSDDRLPGGERVVGEADPRLGEELRAVVSKRRGSDGGS